MFTAIVKCLWAKIGYVQLNFAWERWRELASSEFDFNLTFLNTAAQTLEKIMDPKERAALKVAAL